MSPLTEPSNSATDALRKPLWTSIAVDVDEFDSLELEDKLHIIINVRDLRAIVAHAVAVAPQVEARYSFPNRPMQIAYDGDGITCRFVLMTVGERQGQKQQPPRGGGSLSNGAAAAGQRRATTIRKTRETATNGAAANGGGLATEEARPTRTPSAAATSVTAPRPPTPPGSMMPPPPPPSHTQRQRAEQSANDAGPAYPFGIVPPRRPTASSNQQEPPASESLFVESNDEYVWDPVRLEGDDEDEDDARLEWDASEDAVSIG